MKNTIKKTPTLLQIEAVECGAVALGIILAYHGKHLSIEQLREECGVSRNGSNALNMIKAGRKLGIDGKAYRVHADFIEESHFPAIIFWKNNHFLVLEGIYKDEYYLNDPGSGHRKVKKDEFEKCFSDIIITFVKNEHFVPTKSKESSYQYLKGILKQIPKSVYLFMFLSAFVMTSLSLIIPAFSKVFIDMILVPQKGNLLIYLIQAMILSGIIQAVSIFIYESTLLKLKISIGIQNSLSFFEKILKLPINFFEQRYAGSIINSMSSTDNIANFVSNDLLKTSIDFVFSFLFLFLMFHYNVTLTLISLFFMIANMLIVSFTSKLIREEYMIMFNDENKLSGVAISGIKSIESLKANGQENQLFLNLMDQYALLQNRMFQLNIKQKMIKSIPALTEFLSTMMILLIGGLKIMDSSISIGTFVAFQALSISFYKPLQKIMSIIFSLQMMKADQKRLEDIERHPQDAYLNRNPKCNQIKKLSGAVEVRNLSFTYNKLEPPFIKDFNLKVEAGKRVALVGLSGSGKSTIGKLIAGLLQPNSGEILFDDTPVQQIDLQVINSSLAYAEQDVVLFSGSVKENICMWSDESDEEEMLKASKDACIHDLITGMKDKYMHDLQENGRNLSGGMKQRLEIARCLYHNPSILILDEATSAVDSKTESEIDLNLRKRGCTCIVISHRLSTIRDCDEIIVLKNGEIIQRGKHQDLIKEKNSFYSELIEM